jgi:phosphohistidine phosphatase
MNLFLVRHGEAEKISFSVKDYERKLTDEGRSKIISTARLWKALIICPDKILSSPLVRSLQTAEMIREIFDYPERVLVDNNLAPGCKTSDLIEIVNFTDVQNIMLIGHEPDISNHISNLISNNPVSVRIHPFTIAKISFDRQVKFSKGNLDFLIPPLL